MKWVLVVMVLWNNYPTKLYEIEMRSEDACKEAMFLVERKLMSDAMISEHDGYTVSCAPKEE